MGKNLLFLSVVCASWLSGLSQTSTQIKTATFLNDLNQFRDFFGDQNFPKATAADLAANDDIYGCSSKLLSIPDSSKPFNRRSVSSLALQGFGFTIPDGATIENIIVTIRRFKDGRPSVGDYFLSVMQRYQSVPDTPSTYGRMWTYRDTYPGKIYPDTETEYVFSQGGSGNDGGFDHIEAYQWTPAIVNQATFGVRVDNYAPIGRGPVQICYDLVEVTIEYSQPLILARRLPVAGETKPLKKPIVYPNPFTTKANIQFVATESGKAVVELFNYTGTKIKTLFSSDVLRGQLYDILVADARLTKGIYVYRISIGKEIYRGRMIKVE
jgi:type IX secretion system substrate protein